MTADVEDETPTRETFVITDNETLAWALRKIRDAKSRISEESLTAQKIIEKLKAEVAQTHEWLEKETADDRRTIQYFEGHAVEYLMRLREADPDKKSVTTPFGKVHSREQPPTFERDDDILKEWAVANGYTRQRIDIDWDAIKKAAHVSGERLVLDDGEVIPGVTVAEQPRKFGVTCSD